MEVTDLVSPRSKVRDSLWGEEAIQEVRESPSTTSEEVFSFDEAPITFGAILSPHNDRE